MLKVRIVHLDDNKIFRDGLANSCIWPVFTNPELIEFSDGDKAYDFIKNEINAKNQIDLIITDINHPGLKGDELAKSIRLYEGLSNSSMRIPILIISMVEEKNFPELKENKIVDAYLSKATEVSDIIDCFKNILNMTLRVVGKVSDENLEEGIINLIAKMLGVSPSEVTIPEEMLQQAKLINQEKIEIKKIINPFFDDLNKENTKENSKKRNELIDLGKFIYYWKKESEIKIIECSEHPDFIVKYQEELIGIEHTSLYDDDVVAEISNIKRAINEAQNMLTQQSPTLQGLFNIIVLPERIRSLFQTSKKENIVETITNYITSLNNGETVDKPDFIDTVTKTSQAILELTLGEKYWLAELNYESIMNLIAKKESKIDSYKKTKGINKCWLFIVINGASSSSSFKVDLKNLPKHDTPFDEIFIFDNFKGHIINNHQ